MGVGVFARFRRRVVGGPARGRQAARRQGLRAELLERRLALAAIPSATISGPVGSLIGQEIPLTVTFDNTATDPADIGYAPFVNIVMPATGDAPPLPNDGISFKPGTAVYNGLALPTTVLTFNTQGKATHPFAKNPDGTAVVVSGKPGDQLVVVQLPFGSYGPEQPAAAITFTGVISPLAQPNHSYPVTATGGFQFQTDASGNPTVDVAMLGATTTDPIDPQLFTITKTSSAPEAETATGPNFKHTYTVSMAVAPGQTVNDVLLSDVLPTNVQFVSVNAATGNGSTTSAAVSTPSTSVPGGALAWRFDRVVGTGSPTDAVLTFTYFMPRVDRAGIDVIPLGTGGTASATNTAAATGTWTSANPNFPATQTVASGPADAGTRHTLTARTVALQKAVADLTSPGSPRAGDTLRYTLSFQVSDYFAVQEMNIADVLGDGQDFDASFVPVITFAQKTETFVDKTFASGNFTTVPRPDGTTDVTFRVSAQLAALGLTTGGKLVGAGIPNAGTGSASTPPNPLPGGPGTTGTITFQTRVRNTYKATGAAVVQGDVISDAATTTAGVLDYANLSATGSAVNDGSSAAVTVVQGAVAKSIYAINGVPASGTPVVTAGDAVTFRITYELPFSSIKDYKITDFLPLPIFAAENLAFAPGPPSGSAPAAGRWKYGPADTYAALSGITPTTSFAAAANSLTWNFGTFEDGLNRSSRTDILFTVTATNRPFADGLLLTNQAEQTERNETDDLLTSRTALAQVKISEPLLGITKGVVSTNDPAGVFRPVSVAPTGVTFSQPGLPGASFTGTVTSTGLASTPIVATLSNVLGNDLVKFCIVVENRGSGREGSFDVKVNDAFDAARMAIPTTATGLNLRVTDGTGAAMPFTGDLFSPAGITLTDPGPTPSPGGSLDPGKTTSGTVIDTGRNIAIITYDLRILPGVAPLDVMTNTARLTNYASTEGGPNFLPPAGIAANTTVTVQSPVVRKTLVGTSIDDPFNSSTQGVIGEIATFELAVDVPRGTTPNAVVVDSLPTGLAFVRMVGSPTVDPGVSFTGSATPTLTNSGRTVTFSLGDVVNSNADAQRHGITVRYEAVVLNVSTNVAGKTLTNSAKLTWTGHSELAAATSSPVTVIEPKLTIDKASTPTTAQAGDTVTFTIVVAASQTTAHDVTLADIFPGGITYVPGSLRHAAGVAPATLATSGGGGAFTAGYVALSPGQTSTLEFRARVDADVVAGRWISNTATTAWTSLAGSPGQLTPNNPSAYERTGSESTSQGQLNNYKTADSAVVTIAQPTVDKALVTTSIVNASNSAAQAVVGERATYTVTMKIPQGRTPTAKLIDSMGPGMAFVRVVSAVNDDPGKLVVPGLNSAPALTSQATVATWDLGDIVNSDTDSSTDETITFTIETVILNVAGNTGGTSLRNEAHVQWDGFNTSRTARSGPVTVIEPKLQTIKSAVVGGFGGTVGDPVTYTIVVRQSSASDTDAFDVTLRDAIPASIIGPALTQVEDTAGLVTAANFGLAGNLLTTTGTGFDLPKLPAGRTITLTVTGTLGGPLVAGEQITNTNEIKWSSLSGSPGQITPNNPNAFERTGSGSTSAGQLNNYVTNAAATITPTTADLAIAKTVSQPTPNVGDTITFTVTLTNNGPNTAHLVEVTDRFPTAGLQLLSATASQGDFNQASGVWNVGTMRVGTANRQTLTITAKVLAPAVNTTPQPQANVATVTKAAEIDPVPGNNSGSATETPKFADLGVKKTTSNPTPNAGDTVFYTVSLFNLGTSAATNVEVTDSLPANVTFVNATPSAGTFNGTTKVWSIPNVPTTNGVGNPLTLTLEVVATSGGGFNTVTITKSDVWDPNNRNNTAKTPTGTQEADLVVSKTVNDDAPNVGDDVTFTIMLDNAGPSTARSPVLNDLLPQGLEYRSHTASAGTYLPGTGVWTLPDLAAGTGNTLTVVARVLAPTAGPARPATNTATATATTPDPNPLNNTADATVAPRQADLAVVKTVDDPTPNVGDTITFTIQVANRGPDTATSVVVNDQLPAGLTFVSATPSQGTYSQSTGVWTVGTVTTGTVPVLAVRALVDRPNAGPPRAVTNRATVAGREYDPDPANNTGTATETPQFADLGVEKSVDNLRPNVGDTLTYTVTLTNLGRDTATGVILLDKLPAGMQFVAAAPSQGSYDAGTGVWTVGTVDTRFSRTLIVTAIVLPPPSGRPLPQTNTASVQKSDQYDPNPANDWDTVTTTPQYADLVVKKSVDDPRPNVGGNVTYTVEVTNAGPDPATGVVVQDVLPAGLSFVSASPQAGTSFEPASGTWTVNSLAVGRSSLLVIVATVAGPGTFTNVAAVTRADQFDPEPGNNRDTSTVATRAADLAVVKSVSDVAPNVGDTISFTVTLRNDGPDTAHNVQVTDKLPTTGLAFLSATPSQGSYAAGTGIWTVGTIPADESQTLVILARVLAPPANMLPPTQTNVATVTRADEYDPNPGNNTGTATETPQVADLAVTKTASDPKPNVGDVVVYTVRLANLGTATATNVEVTDALPDNVAFVSATPVAGTRFQRTPTGGVWSVPRIAVGETFVLTLVVRATASSVAFNTATISHSDVWDPNDRNNTARTPTEPQQADLFVSKTVDVTAPNVGSNVTFTVRLENLGVTDAANVAVNDLLPEGLGYVSDVASAGTYAPGTGVLTLGTVPMNAVRTLRITALVNAPAAGPALPQTNIATATSSTPDPNPGNNTASSTVTPQQADLAVVKTVDDATPTVGDTVTFQVVVSNLGPSTATAVVVTDLLPAGLAYLSSVASRGTYAAGSGRWEIGTLTPADPRPTLTVRARVTATTSGTIANVATAAATEWDPDTGNNAGTAELLVRPSGVIVGTDIGCETGPFVRVIDPDTGADRIVPFFAYEPQFRGGCRVYGADVTGDGIPEIITAPGPGRSAEVRVFTSAGAPLPQYSFFPFGPGYDGGLEIAAGPITAAGGIQIVASQSRGGTVRVFDVTPGAAAPVAAGPIREVQPFGPAYRSGVFIDTADVGTFAGQTRTSTAPDGILELVVGSGPGMRATVGVYNGVPATPTLVNAFNPFAAGYERGVSVARLPSRVTGQADRILASSGSSGGSLVETWSGMGSVRDAAFAAYAGSRADVFSAAIDDDAIFSVEGTLGRINGVRRFSSPAGAGRTTLPQSTGSYPPLRVAILRR